MKASGPPPRVRQSAGVWKGQQRARPITVHGNKWSPHRQEPVAPFKNATSREFRIPPPAGAGGFQFAGIDREKCPGMRSLRGNVSRQPVRPVTRIYDRGTRPQRSTGDENW
jgi:hypothetical protein